jgi:DNA polymerase elongation subunit (family B)
MSDGMYIPTYNVQNEKGKFEGGYVKEPVPGLYENIVTYDANSLYPNTLITLNISPETKVGKITKIKNDDYYLKLSNNKEVILSKQKYDKLIKKENLAVSKSNVIYSQKFKGVIPKFVDNLYDLRVKAKKEQGKYEKLYAKETDENVKLKYKELVNDNKTLSEVYKVVLNSCYGVFSQKFSPLFDLDHAESITLTGQAAVKHGAQIMYDKFISEGVDCKFDDIVRYSDTDSIFIEFTKILNKNNITLSKNNIIEKDADTIIENCGDHLNKEIQEWARKELNSIDPRYVFKREKICDIAVLQKKKFYILHILDSEGIPKNEFMYKGIEVAKSILSKEVKMLIKESIETAILSKNKETSMKIFNESFEKFLTFSEELLSVRKKVNDYDKGERGYANGKYALGTPNHTKAAINYNELLKRLEIDNKPESEDEFSKTNLGKGILTEDDQIFVQDGDRCWFVKLGTVRLFESLGNYVRIYFDNNKPLILRSLNSLEERLDPKSFFRANRKHIINLKMVESIEPYFSGGLLVKLKTGEKIEISRRQAIRFKDMLSL